MHREVGDFLVRLERKVLGSVSRTAMLAGAACLLLPAAARADDQSVQIQQLQNEIRQLQSQLNFLAARQAQSEQKVAATAAVESAATETRKKMKGGQFTVGDGAVKVTLGGFAAAESAYRNRNEYADIGSDFNGGLPFANSPNNHQSEFRGSARQSRISLLAQGDIDKSQHLASYFETDFLSAGVTSNTRESNSYTLRLRLGYATYDNDNYGFHFLGGQNWSLVTLQKVGITPRQEDIPLTIDAQYVPGFNWTRNWQFRVAQDFADKKFWVAASVEGPQAVTGGNGAGATAVGGTNNFCTSASFVASVGCGVTGTAGAGLLNNSTTYSSDMAPDIVVKVAADPGWGHYELYGLGRFFRNRVETTGGGRDKVTMGGGIGGGTILPIVPKMLDVQFSFLGGYGIGRYGSSQFPDFTISPDGSVVTLPEIEALLGVVAHPTPAWDVYGYVGTEQVQRTSFNVAKGFPAGVGAGYGSPTAATAGCIIEGGACSAFTQSVTQATIGAWWRVYKGDYGTMQLGVQDSFTRRAAFNGTAGNPSATMNALFTSFRYYPYQ